LMDTPHRKKKSREDIGRVKKKREEEYWQCLLFSFLAASLSPCVQPADSYIKPFICIQTVSIYLAHEHTFFFFFFHCWGSRVVFDDGAERLEEKGQRWVSSRVTVVDTFWPPNVDPCNCVVGTSIHGDPSWIACHSPVSCGESSRTWRTQTHRKRLYACMCVGIFWVRQMNALPFTIAVLYLFLSWQFSGPPFQNNSPLALLLLVENKSQILVCILYWKVVKGVERYKWESAPFGFVQILLSDCQAAPCPAHFNWNRRSQSLWISFDGFIRIVGPCCVSLVYLTLCRRCRP
jgi:hypothetical protein